MKKKLRHILHGEFFRTVDDYGRFTYYMKLRNQKAVNLNSHTCIECKNFAVNRFRGYSLNLDQDVETIEEIFSLEPLLQFSRK